ncbi:MAG: hypothetical protein ABSB35_42495, partial [Bryobacteraceae bacterium]
ALPPAESTAHSRDQHRIRRFSESQESRVECHLLRIPAESHNFHRKHMTLKTTPAVKAGIANHIWSIEEIIGLLEAREQKAA